MNMTSIEKLVAKGESDRVELKKSTAQLKGAGQTLCAFLNAEAGKVVFGVTDNGKVVGQEVSDKTRREIAAMLDRFEPPAPIEVTYLDIPGGSKKVIVLDAPPRKATSKVSIGIFAAENAPR